MSALPLTAPVPILAVLTLMLLLAPALASRLRLPPLVVLILLGCIGGEHGLGLLARDAPLLFLEQIGLLYIMLLAGLQMDLSNLKQVGMRSLLFGLLTFSLPFSVGALTGQLMTVGGLTAILLGLLYAPHTLLAYPTMARFKLVQRDAIGVAIGGTVVTSLLTLIGFAILQAAAQDQLSPQLWLQIGLGLPVLVGLSTGLLPRLGKPLISSATLNTQFIFVLTTLFILAAASQRFGVDAIVGAFIAGLTLNPLIASDSPLMTQLDFVGNSLFIPIFMVTVGMLANPQVLVRYPSNLGIALIIVLGAVGAKFLAAWVTQQWFGYSRLDMLTLFSLSVPRAALVMIMAVFGQQANLISVNLFNALLAYILLTCLLGPILSERWGQRLAINDDFAI